MEGVNDVEKIFCTLVNNQDSRVQCHSIALQEPLQFRIILIQWRHYRQVGDTAVVTVAQRPQQSVVSRILQNFLLTDLLVLSTGLIIVHPAIDHHQEESIIRLQGENEFEKNKKNSI